MSHGHPPSWFAGLDRSDQAAILAVLHLWRDQAPAKPPQAGAAFSGFREDVRFASDSARSFWQEQFRG